MMLYEWYEANRALLSPFSEFASASSKLYNHPLSLFAHIPNAHRVSAGLELMHRLAKDYEKPEFGIRSINVSGVDVAVHERIAIAKPFCRLVRFKRFTDDMPTLQRLKKQPTVLVVAPLSGHHSTLLRDTVRELLKGHKVFITDWADARMVPEEDGPFHLDDYVAYVQEFIRLIGPEVNVISVCQPTVPVLAAVSLLASAGEPTPRTMTMMGGPIDARKSPTAVNNLALNKSHVLVREQRDPPRAGQLSRRRAARLPRLPAARRLHRDEPGPAPQVALRLLPQPGARRRRERRLPPRLLRRVQRRPRHAGRVLPRHGQDRVPGLRARQRDVGRQGRAGAAAGHPHDRAADDRGRARRHLRGRADQGRAPAVHRRPGRPALPLRRIGAGHYGIFSGSRWREKVYPKVRDFIATHQQPVAPAAAAKKRTVRGKRRAVSA